MTATKEQVFKVFTQAHDQEIEASDIKRGAMEDLKVFAENHQLDLKSLKAAYALYKKYLKGKPSLENNDYYELITLVEDYFAVDGEEE